MMSCRGLPVTVQKQYVVTQHSLQRKPIQSASIKCGIDHRSTVRYCGAEFHQKIIYAMLFQSTGAPLPGKEQFDAIVLFIDIA